MCSSWRLVTCMFVVAPRPVTTAEQPGDGEPMNWRLACRLASYGKYQDAAWNHLPSIGVHHVFLSVPEAGEIDDSSEAARGSSSQAAGDARTGRPGGAAERRRAGRATRRLRADGGSLHVPLAPAHGRRQGDRLRAAAPGRGDRQAPRRDHRPGDPSRPGHQRRRPSAKR